jgi:hypothetical protein
MVLVYTNPRGQTGEYVELLTASQGAQPALSLAAALPLTAFGLQSSWAIDPTNGDDNAAGTPAAPLRTMAEFNNRLSFNSLQQATTLQLVGDVLDEPLQLQGTRIKLGASLTVSGTQTLVGSGTISVVTPLGNGGTTFPFQLTTAGFNWSTAAVGTQILFSNSTVGWIKKVVDANNVQIGAVTTLASSALVTPTNALTFQAFTLSRAQLPLINVSGQNAGAITANVIQLQNLSLDGGTNCALAGSGGLIFAGCELKFPTTSSVVNLSSDTMLFRSCRWTITSGPNIKSAAGRLSIIAGCCVATAGNSNLNYGAGADNLILGGSFQGIAVNVTAGTLQFSNNGAHFDGVTSGSIVTVSFGGFIVCNGSGSILNGSNCAGATVGIDANSGRLLWNGAANKPTIGVASGAGLDVRLGSGGTGITYTYATLGTGKQLALLDGIPPVAVQVQSGGYSCVAQIG